MSVPSKVVGSANNSSAQNVFKITFSEATSDAPRLEAWDDFSFSTTTKEVFAGTVGNGSKPILCGVATTDAAPASGWVPAAATAGGATINRMEGSTSYLDLAAAAVAAAGAVRFNLDWEIPYDATIPADMDAVIVCRFSYTGAAPVLTWEFNDDVAGGSEASPVWTTITPGDLGHVLRPGDSGSTAANLVIHRPISGVADSAEVWVVEGS